MADLPSYRSESPYLPFATLATNEETRCNMSRSTLLLTLFVISQSFVSPVISTNVPDQAQIIDQRVFNVLNNTRPPAEFNATNVFVPPGSTGDSLTERPFHVYDEEFLKIIGKGPTLTRIAHSSKDPLFHEAVVWSRETDEVFFVQNAGAKNASTGLKKSAIIEKISLAQAAAVSDKTDAVGLVNVTTVPSLPMVVNPNGEINPKTRNRSLIFTSEGQGDDKPPGLSVVNPKKPYNSTVILNNYFGRQFNSLNDVAIHPKNKEIYFTDTIYGWVQDFRPAPGLQDQIYRFNPDTGAVTVVADDFDHPNGLTFSPDGDYAYITDTGISNGFFGMNFTRPASVYRYDVKEDGTFENRKLFAFVNSGAPDGIHCDSWGNVYAGCGDGVQVWNPSGKLLGKIYVGATSANFNFAGKGRMVICAETDLYYATLAAGGNYVDSEM
ncbi:SMP-30/Gluconolaconase/LRE-like region [Penicillium soppii]|uniref:SMP-30/Gluconolaconase/LRE-like region n=1 Tax=Penicillium soppii TaxID=69789 RepID=UPI0025499EDF|nr:SMP-30/Gluconolaconase/LRE-like region [Penicillium soppii]KAJ5860288.1 SMP-30/Gluconolaconase/LRE-like region [Penicillium soppii]